MPSSGRLLRNARLLLQSGIQHLVDDPALLVVQVSRRLPFSTRVRAGTAVRAITSRIPGGGGAAALGAFMAGDVAGAEQLIERSAGSRSRIRGEVAVLLDRFDLVARDASPATRARAAWMRGDLSGAVETLERAGQSHTRYAHRLRSELQLLSPGYRLPVTARSAPANPPHAEGDRLRVLHLLTNSLPHTQSGYSLRSHRILTAMRDQGIESAALTRTGYPVMIGIPTAADEDVVDGIRYVRTLPARLPQTQEQRLQAEVARALQLVAEFRPHVIHATTNYHNALVAQAVSAATGLPWMLEVRGLMEKTWAASRPSPEGKLAAAVSQKARRVAEREAELATSADAVVAISETMVAELAQRGVDTNRVAIVPNGVDDALLTEHQGPHRARRALGVGMDGAFIVGSVSAVVDYEGFDVLLRAAALIIEDPAAPALLRERLHVLIAGDGTAAPGLRALAAELGIADRVLMPGRVPRHAARDWVQALDAVAIPRLDLEVARTVTPQKPVEALALGRPVIISDLPALRETVTAADGTLCAVTHAAGSVEDLADAIIGLGCDPARATRLVEQGGALAAERTWPALIQRYGTLYTDLLAQHQEEHARG